MSEFEAVTPIVVETDSRLNADSLSLRPVVTNDVPSVPAYYPYFDYLRIGLAIVVMFYHDHLIPWEHSGNLAVQIFFALSAPPISKPLRAKNIWTARLPLCSQGIR